jgi:CHAT domain-containing protein/Tfp pilus assembly protein PilF
VQHSTDEAALRALGEAFFHALSAKNLDEFMRLWSANSPELEARRKRAQELFANSAGIEVTDLLFRQFKVDGEKAFVRIELKMTVIDAKTNRERGGFGKILRTLRCVKEVGNWKVEHELSTYDELAESVVAAKTEQERSAIIESIDGQGARIAILIRAGQLYKAQGKYEMALSIFQKARGLSEAGENKAELGTLLQRIGEVYQLLGKYNDAIDSYQKSLFLAETMQTGTVVVELLGRLAILHSLLGSFDAALGEAEKSLFLANELKNPRLIANAVLIKGNVYLTFGELSQAAELYQQSLALAEKIGEKILIDPCLNNLGIIYRIRGDYHKALYYLERSLKLAEEKGEKPGIAQTLNSIGLVYLLQGNQDVAIEYYHRSLSLLGDSKGRTVVDTLQNTGLAAIHQEKYERALESFGKALSLAESSQDLAATARALAGIGVVYYQIKKFEESASYLQRSLELNEKAGGREARSISLIALGRVRHSQGDYARAMELADRAASLSMDIDNREITSWHRALTGRIYLSLNDLQKARQAFDESIAAIESLRTEVVGLAGGQNFFLEDRLYPYRAMIELLVRQNQTRDALVYAERSKARVILDVLRNGRPDIHKAMTAEEQRQERRLIDNLIYLNRRLTQAAQSADLQLEKIRDLRAQIEKARLNYETFQASLYAAHPEMKTHRGEAPSIDPGELAALLPDTTSALLEYVIVNDKTYLFAVTKTAGKAEAEIRVYPLPMDRDEIAKQTEMFRRQLAVRDLGFRASAAELYSRLIKPAEAQLRGKTNIVIVPDGKLWELPFQALLTGANRFLIEDAAIAYTPSLTALREMIKRRKSPGANSPPTLLALGNPQLGRDTINRAALAVRDEKLDPLPEAEQEVKALIRLYGVTQSRVYTGAEAREDRVKSEASQAGILHFATHGMLNNASPMYSHLALAQGGANEDGLLEAWELMQLDLKAELAVLSACETARGRASAGEGMIGLTWAMFIAGVPSTVVSQWKVESASTRDLMLGFHRQLRARTTTAKAKMTKAQALRHASLMLMKNPETSHPFYWAGFVLVGDGR